MSARIHFQSWPEPHLFDGEDLTVPCGITLAKAVAVAMVDTDYIEPGNTLQSGCRRCQYYIPTRRYCYAVVSGEESKQMERK